MTILSNTTVISNFALIDQLDFLRRLLGRIYIPTAVYHEITAGIDEGYQFCRLIQENVAPFHAHGWIQLTNLEGEKELAALSTLPNNIHQGEAECLVIARERGWLLLTDDRAARKIGRSWDIHLSGTLGCLMLAITNKQCDLTEANHYLAQMIAGGYRSPVTDLLSLM